jgi:hypothetical protein
MVDGRCWHPNRMTFLGPAQRPVAGTRQIYLLEHTNRAGIAQLPVWLRLTAPVAPQGRCRNQNYDPGILNRYHDGIQDASGLIIRRERAVPDEPMPNTTAICCVIARMVGLST